MTAQPQIMVRIDFGKRLRQWDGFGFNYVETCQTRDYDADPQEYGGFSLLQEPDRQKILEMVFGEDGLKPALVKMFLDSLQQPAPGADYDYDAAVIDPAAYDHARTTGWMRYFVRNGLAITRARGADLTILTTLYGPPGWTTQQRSLRGRDLDPALKTEVAKYMIAWTNYLRRQEGFPVKYISLHNEGEDWGRWPADGADDPAHARHDYNMYWPPELVADFLRFMPALLTAHGLDDVTLSCGETTNWHRFQEWGYADAIADDPAALAGLGLITSHGFYKNEWQRFFGDWRSAGIDTLRAAKPELHAWVTSTSWSKMDCEFVNEIRNNIYAAKINGLIPWAGIQVRGRWVGGDPNPGCAFEVFPDGSWNVLPGYYYYKQVARAGMPGMAVAQVRSNDTLIAPLAFASNGAGHPAAFVVINMHESAKAVQIEVRNSASDEFAAYRTSPDGENYAAVGDIRLQRGVFLYTAPARSVTTFFAA